MSLSMPKLGRRNAVLLTTLLLILASFAYYFLVFVEGNESRFIDRAYRVLDRKATNIENKYSGYESYLTFVFNSVKGVLADIIAEGGKEQSRIQELEARIQILYEDYPKNAERILRYQRSIEQLEARLDSRVRVKIKDTLNSAIPEVVRLDYFSKDGISYERADYYSFDQKGFEWHLETVDASYVSFSEKAETFVSSVLKNGLFDEYILLKEINTYSEFSKDKEYSMVFQTFKNPIDLESIGPKLQHNTSGKQTGDSLYLAMGPKMVKPMDVNLFNNGYKLLFHRLELDNVVYYLGGFVQTKVFERESQKVEIMLLVLSILFILLLLIAMPVMKLVFMSSIERLHIRNVVMTGGSLVLGLPIVLLIIFSIYEFVVKGNSEIDDNLVQLSSDIEERFEQEVGTILTKLDEFDSLMCLTPDNLEELDFSPYREFNHVFWIDQHGVAKQNMQRTLLFLPPSTIDVHSRDYFQKVVGDQMWKFSNDTIDFNFYLQSIVSWNDFTNEAAISIPSRLRTIQEDSLLKDKYPVAVMTSQLRSVTDAILPQGYAFAIIDAGGQVKFHSDRDRILQENFLEETENSADIRSAIYARIGVDTDLKYHNVNHRAYIQPINSTPLFLITLYDNEHKNAKIQGIVSLSIILLFGTFAGVCLMVLLLWIIQRRKSKLRINNFLFHWTKPDEGKHLEYQFLTILFFVIGLGLLWMIANVSEQDVLFTFIISNAYLFLISFTWIAPKQTTRYTERPTERRNFNLAFISFIVIADLAYVQYTDGSKSWILYQLVLTILVLFSQNIRDWVERFYINIPRISTLQFAFKRNSYNLFLFSWLMISSVLPIFFIFMVSHNEEEIIWQKHNQLKIAEQFQEKVRKVNSRSEALKNDEDLRQHFYRQKLFGSTYLLDSELSLIDSKGYLHCLDSGTRADHLISEIRPHYSEIVTESKGLVFDVSEEKNRKWCYKSAYDRSGMKLSFTEIEAPFKRKDYSNIYITTDLDLLKFGQQHGVEKHSFTHYKWMFRLSILLILASIYALIDYCTNKIYGREYINFRNTLPLTVENFKKISIGDDSITHHKQRQIFLLGLPKSNKSNLIKAIDDNLIHIDMMWVNSEDKWKDIQKIDLDSCDGIVLENFEYGISSHEINKERLELLERLTCDHSIQVIISSDVNPSFVTDFYESKLEASKDDEIKHAEFAHSLETWRHILGGFIVVHNPIKENSKINGFLRSSWIKSEVFKQLFRLELNKGSFLPNLLPGIKDYFIKLKKNVGGDESKIDKEDIILRIQLLAESYYLGLWNTLSKEEKYIIYDLAKDRFVNTNNKNGIRSLLEKGLLIYDNELTIMNESFTNFVLSIIKKEEALIMEKEVRDKGAWSTISSVLILAVIGLFAFLFVGNPDFFQDFNALISVFVAIIGMVPRLGGILSFSKPQPTEGN